MQIVSWTLGRACVESEIRVIDTIRAYDPDILILLEIPREAFHRIEDGLSTQSWGHWFSTRSTATGMRSLVLSHWPITRRRQARASTARGQIFRFCVEAPHLEVVAVAMPRGTSASALRRAAWKEVRKVTEDASAPALVIGTFDLTLSQARTRLDGLHDLWSSPNHPSEEITFRSRSDNAARVDLALGTASVRAARFRCEYDHLGREQLISSHSLIRLDLDEERIGVSPNSSRGRLHGPGTK